MNFYYLSESSKVKPTDVLQFISGSCSLPALGFEKKITITFKHGCPPLCKCKPTVSTCDLTLHVPTHLSSNEEMQKEMEDAILMNYGFGRV